MKITLIYPGITDTGFDSLKGVEGSWINHGLAILSAALKADGNDVELLDLRGMKGWEDFRDTVIARDMDAVGITMMSVDFNIAVKAATIIKEVKSHVKIFVGGPHPSILPGVVEKESCFDCIVRGEGEVTFPRLIRDLADQGLEIPRIVQGEKLENLDESPWADRNLFSYMEAPAFPFFKPPFVTLIAGRGCQYNCNFCQPSERIIFGKKVRRRSVKSVIDELKFLEKQYSFNSWMIHDDCITEDRAWVEEFCAAYKSSGFTQPFFGHSRADIICKNPDMVEMLADAGMQMFIVGFESGSDRVLKYLRKGCTRAQNLEAARILKAYKIKIWANYMLGIPTETNDEIMETYSMLKQIAPYHCSPSYYAPHPGSDLFKLGEEQGFHLDKDPEELYSRSRFKPTIKGPDYRFVNKMFYKTIVLGTELIDPFGGAGEEIPIYRKMLLLLKGRIKRHAPFIYAASRALKQIKKK